MSRSAWTHVTVEQYLAVLKEENNMVEDVPSCALQLSIVLSKLLMGLFGVVRAAAPPCCCWFCCCCCCCTVSLSSFRSISAFTRSEKNRAVSICMIKMIDYHMYLYCLYWPRLRLRMPPVPAVLSCLGTNAGLKAFGLAATLPAGPIFPETGDAAFTAECIYFPTLVMLCFTCSGKLYLKWHNSTKG